MMCYRTRLNEVMSNEMTDRLVGLGSGIWFHGTRLVITYVLSRDCVMWDTRG